MAFQTIEMKILTDKLESQTETYLETHQIYETKKQELLEDLQADNINRLQEYDLMIFKEALRDKQNAYHDIQVTREQIKLRELLEKAQSLPNPSKEYFEVFIAYWQQKLVVIRIRNGEYSYNKYKPVANYQISKARNKLEAVA